MAICTQQIQVWYFNYLQIFFLFSGFLLYISTNRNQEYNTKKTTRLALKNVQNILWSWSAWLSTDFHSSIIECKEKQSSKVQLTFLACLRAAIKGRQPCTKLRNSTCQPLFSTNYSVKLWFQCYVKTKLFHCFCHWVTRKIVTSENNFRSSCF